MYWETVMFMGNKYIVSIDDGGMRGFIFTVSKVGVPLNLVIIDGLTKEEADKIIKALKSKEPKQIDDWVDCVFFSEPIAGKHAQEIFEDRLKKAMEEGRCV